MPIVLFCVAGWAVPIGSSLADDATLTHLAHLMADEAAGENAPELDVDFAPDASFAGVPIQLEKTRLEDIQTLFGGALHAHDAAVGAVTWLCFARPAKASAQAQTIWFASSSDGSASDGHPITLIAVQEIDAGASDGCAASSGSALPIFGVPGLGATAVQLKKQFGQLPYDRSRNVYYDSVRPLGDGSGKSIYQRLAYIVTRKGIVVGMAVTQTTN